MNTIREAAQQALEALGIAQDHWHTYHGGLQSGKINEAITTLRAALEQPEPFQPDWDRIEPLQEALREHMAEIHRLRAALEQPEQTNYTEEKLQAVAKYVGDKYHVWYGIGARDVEEVLRQSARLGLVTLNSDTVEQPEKESVAAEREACAKVCDEYVHPECWAAKECAAAIRARGQA